jgi:hypothetical protein
LRPGSKVREAKTNSPATPSATDKKWHSPSYVFGAP